MPQNYACPCSKREGGSNGVTKRTVEAHLRRDQDLLQSLPSETDLAISVRSAIDRTTQLLSKLLGGHMLPNLALDLEGSCSVGSQGVFTAIILLT